MQTVTISLMEITSETVTKVVTVIAVSVVTYNHLSCWKQLSFYVVFILSYLLFVWQCRETCLNPPKESCQCNLIKHLKDAQGYLFLVLVHS